MKASVILPVYNGFNFLQQSIESILNQNFHDFEFIIIDDGSKDDSWQIIKEYALKDKRITAILHKKNQGLVSTLNECIKLSKSELIIRMDQDDESLPHRIKTQCEFMDKNPKIIVAGSFVYHMGFTLKNDKLIILPTDPEEIKNKLLNTENCIYHPSVIMRKKEILSLGGYRQQFKNCEDYDLWIRATKKYFISNIDIPLLRYRITLSGMTFNKKWEQLFYMFLALESNKNLKADFNQITSLAQKRLNAFKPKEYLFNHYIYSLEELFQLKRYSEAINLITKVFKEAGLFRSLIFIKKIVEKMIRLYPIKLNIPLTRRKKSLCNKHILFAVPYLVLGGADKRLKVISKMLKENKFKISIISTVPVDESILYDTSSQYEELISDIFHMPKLLQNINDWKKFIFYILDSRKINTIFLCGSQYFYEILPEIKSKYPYIKIVDQQFNTGCHFISNRKYAAFIDHIIAENEDIISRLKNNYYENPKKITLIHNGVDTKEFSPNNKLIKTRPSYIPKDKIIISFLGRLSEEKGPDIFIQIANNFRNNNNVYFILAGDGPEKILCEKLIYKSHLENKIFMPGTIDSKQCLKYTDILLVTSRLDGRPNAILESMSMGVPVVSFNVGGIPNMIQNDQNGYLCQNNQEMIDKINFLLNNQSKLLDMKKKTRIYAKEKLDENIHIIKYLKILQ